VPVGCKELIAYFDVFDML